jgi:O-antigen/teichoic acid export membrane protein
MLDQLRSGRVRRVSGAVSGQLSQALVSFVLQLVAAHSLGARGLGVFALVYSAMITTTALCNGLVGDTLTVLDRGRAEIRAALQTWCLVASVGTGVVTAALYLWGGFVDGRAAAWFALANATFLVESMVRRLLMAVMRFWSLVVVDLATLGGSLLTIGVWRVARPLSIEALLIALVVGQLVGLVVGARLLPAEERHLAPWRPAAMRQVAVFGTWRAIQQCIRPSMLTLGRLIVTAAVGAALFGQMEAGRVYMSPALLVVQGLGSYLFSSYAQTKDHRWAPLVRRADRTASVMLVLTLAIGTIGTLLVPLLGPLVTGSSFSMVPLAVFGWAVYAASSAAVMPYASLASVRGRQRLVVGLRAADSLASLGLLAVVMLPGHASASWAPYLLAVGSFVDGAVIRWIVLRRYVKDELVVVTTPAVAGVAVPQVEP